MRGAVVTSISPGLSQKRMRDHNARLLLSLLLRHGELPGSDLARLSGLSAPTVSDILRGLEADGFLKRGDPVRGRVGKPSLPMRIDPEGALSWGFKIGRRSAELILLDLAGAIRAERRLPYAEPHPDEVLAFLAAATAEICAGLSPRQVARIGGIGVAAPFELWSGDEVRHRSRTFRHWSGVDLRDRIAGFSDLPVSIINDATAACRAEHIYGRGREFSDYACFFVGTYIGGGIVLNNSVYEGRRGNAGALGSLRTVGPHGEGLQLVDAASIHLLEDRLSEAGLDPEALWRQPQDWSALARHVDPWLGRVAQELAGACLSTCAVVDFEAVLIDGAFPPSIRSDLVDRVRRYLVHQDSRGLILPRIEAGTIGAKARAIGAAAGPISSQYLLDTNVGMAIA
ncbi:ROK family transcriptional regulator [Jannaschia rubra]|uniref:ROK family transcriptional regulator n=1 Tax=Jannaschia rubra TaxID=282197 RepID=UPI003CD0DD1D